MFSAKLIQLVKHLYVQFNFLAQRGHTHFEGRTRLKSKRKMWSKLQNLLEMVQWHENNSVGQYPGENKIYKLFFPFDLRSP